MTEEIEKSIAHIVGMVDPEYVTEIEKFLVPDPIFLKDEGSNAYYELQL